MPRSSRLPHSIPTAISSSSTSPFSAPLSALPVGRSIISTDSKKKELIGEFKNTGKAWVREPTAVNIHDFPEDALGRAVPYGVYDLIHNRGFVYVGTSGDTPAFATDAIAA